jgi:hypothetical protein
MENVRERLMSRAVPGVRKMRIPEDIETQAREVAIELKWRKKFAKCELGFGKVGGPTG